MAFNNAENGGLMEPMYAYAGKFKFFIIFILNQYVRIHNTRDNDTIGLT